jgi:hypothetical protein
MNRAFGIVLATGMCGLFWGENRALGQVPLQPGISAPMQGPAVSPYLNLLRNNAGFGGSALGAINYYGIVRPEFSYYNALGGLQQQVTANQQTIATGLGGGGGIPVTGHPVGFQTQRGYFLTFSGGGVGGGMGRGGFGGGAVGQGAGFGTAGAGGAGMGNTGMRTGVGAAPGGGGAGGGAAPR